ncbi:MAG: polysaccharide deacetylase family protein [Bryobacteraceae bacterium]
MLRKTVKQTFYEGLRQGARLHAGWKTVGGLPRRQFTIFNLHGINGAISDMTVSPAQFRAQLSALLAQGYKCINLDRARKAAAGQEALTDPSFVLTFDDGYESVYQEALPILEELDLTATVFVTVNFLNKKVAPPWRSKEPALLREYSSQADLFRPLTWPQLDTLVRSRRFTVGSHTMNHELLALISRADSRREIQDAKRELEDRVGREVAHFSYPFGVAAYGAYSQETDALVREAGYDCSVTAEIGSVRCGSGPFLMPRISLVNRDSGQDACAKASGAYDWVATAQRAYQRVFSNPHRS